MFDPVITVVTESEEGETGALANDSTFGLFAAVFSADAYAEKTVAERLFVGAIGINDVSLTDIVNYAEK